MFKQKTDYEMRISDWSSDVCSSDLVKRIQDSESGLYGAQVAGRVHRELRALGGVVPPREFVFMDRAAIGLGSVFVHLRAEINWHRLFHDQIGRASCRERVCQDVEISVVAVSLKKKNKTIIHN